MLMPKNPMTIAPASSTPVVIANNRVHRIKRVSETAYQRSSPLHPSRGKALEAAEYVQIVGGENRPPAVARFGR